MRIFLLVSCMALTFGSVIGLLREGISIYGIGGVIFFGGGSLLFIFQEKWNDLTSRYVQRKRNSRYCVLQKDHFLFPKGYYFKHSSLKDSKTLPHSAISEIRVNTFPPTALINGNELIFLNGLTLKDLNPIKSKIPFSKPQDNWSLLCEEFLDTELSEVAKNQNLLLLQESGFSATEIHKTQKKLEFRMLAKTYLTWEWMYYGQWDVLHELWPMSSKKYWWTMEIALRRI